MATAPATELRAALIALLNTEFAGNGFTIVPGRLHSEAGLEGPIIGVYTMIEREGDRVLDQVTTCVVQVHQAWTRDIDPLRVVDPSTIEAIAQRLRERVYTATHPRAGTPGVWDFRVTSVDYDQDPVGDITRFTAYVQAIGTNYAETTAI